MTEFDCDNFEVPWFTFDGLILSSRAMIVMAVILIVSARFNITVNSFLQQRN